MTTDLKRLAEAARVARLAFDASPLDRNLARACGEAQGELELSCDDSTILSLLDRLEKAERKVEAWGPIVVALLTGDDDLASRLTEDLPEALNPTVSR